MQICNNPMTIIIMQKKISNDVTQENWGLMDPSPKSPDEIQVWVQVREAASQQGRVLQSRVYGISFRIR